MGGFKARPPEERFWENVQKTDTCWIWTGTLSFDGYGRFRMPMPIDGMVSAHRFAYELLVGPIPEGMVLDHVIARGCTNRHCVNPAHLEPVSPKENVARIIGGDRGKARGAQLKSRTHCPQGHEYNEENTYIYKHGRHCKECSRQRVRDRRQRQASQ